MVNINNIDDKRFSLDGINYYKHFTPYVSGQSVCISNAYDHTFKLVNFTRFEEIQVDGNTFPTVALLQNALLPVLFVRGDLGGEATPSENPLYPYVVIGGALIKKDVAGGNSNTTTLESGDKAIWKEITNNGDPVVLLGQTYTGNDEQLEENWSQDDAIL